MSANLKHGLTQQQYSTQIKTPADICIKKIKQKKLSALGKEKTNKKTRQAFDIATLHSSDMQTVSVSVL